MNSALRNSIVVLFILAIVIALIITTARSFNKLQWADEQVAASWAQVVNQYQRRIDLIPNIVRVVKAYAKHERKVFQEIVLARSAAQEIQPTIALLNDPQRLAEYQAAQNHMGYALSRLFKIAEQYPELHSNEAFLDLQAQLEGTENRISYARAKYIQSVSNFNVLVRTVPTSFVANQLDYRVRPDYLLSKLGSTPELVPKIVF